MIFFLGDLVSYISSCNRVLKLGLQYFYDILPAGFLSLMFSIGVGEFRHCYKATFGVAVASNSRREEGICRIWTYAWETVY